MVLFMFKRTWPPGPFRPEGPTPWAPTKCSKVPIRLVTGSRSPIAFLELSQKFLGIFRSIGLIGIMLSIRVEGFFGIPFFSVGLFGYVTLGLVC